RVAIDERQLHTAGGPVAVLGHDDLGGTTVCTLGVVDLVSIDEKNDVGILLERSTFSKVGEHRSFVGSVLQSPGELRQPDHRALQFAGKDLQAAGDLRHLDLAVFGIGSARHQLEVVDDDQAKVAHAALEPARLGPDLHHGQVRVVVDEDVGFAQSTDGVADLGPVGLLQSSGPQTARI